MMRPMPFWDRWRAASSIVSPAPISSAVCSLRSVKICRARLTAAKATDTGLSPIAVSVRTCLAVLKACWNRRCQQFAGAPGFPGGLERAFHLAEDLRLAEHQRVQAAGDRQQVLDDLASCVRIQVRRDIFDRQAVEPGEPFAGQFLCIVFDIAVHLGAVAGRQDHPLADAGQIGQAAQRRDNDIGAERHPLADVYRRGGVVETDGEQGHSVQNNSILNWKFCDIKGLNAS